MDQNINVRGTASFDATPAITGARNLLKEFRTLRDFAKNMSTLTVTAKLSGNIKTELRAALTDVGNREFVIKAKLAPGALDAIKRDLQSIAGINVSVLTAAQAQTATQITQLRGLIAELRSLGGNRGPGGGGGAGGTGGVSANTNRLLQELEQLNNAYKRGGLSAADYENKMRALQVSLRASASTATAGTKEFRALDGALTRTAQGLQRLEAGKVTQLKNELAAADAAFRAASASATTTAQRVAALGARNAEVNRITVALQGMASSGRLTAAQLSQVNTLLAQTAARSAALNSNAGGLGGFGGAIGGLLQNLSSAVPGLGGITSAAGPMGVAVAGAAAAVIALSAALVASFKSAAMFEQAMVDIKALTTPTTAEFVKLTDAAKTLGQDLGVGASESARAMLELNKAGLSAQDVIGGGLTGALNLAGAAGISAAEGSKLAVTAMTAFGRTANDLPQIADTFANFSNLTVLGAEDLGQALAAVGPVAKSSGLDLNEFAGLMATLAQGGFRAMSDAGTSLKTMLLSLKAPSSEAAKIMNRLGLEVYDAQGNMRPFADVMQDLRVKLGALSEESRNADLKGLFGTDGIRAAEILYAVTAEQIEETTASMAKNGESARVAKARLDSYEGQVKKMKSAWENFRIEIGEKFLPVATQLVEGMTNLSDVVSKSFNDIQGAGRFIGSVIKSVNDLNSSLAPLSDETLLIALRDTFADIAGYAKTISMLTPGGLVKAFTEDAAKIQSIKENREELAQSILDSAKAYKAEGTAISDLQAKAAAALYQMQDLERRGDAEGARAARARLSSLQEQIRGLSLLQQVTSEVKFESGGVPAVDPEEAEKAAEALKDQLAAVESLKKSLKDRQLQFRLEGLEGVARDVEQVRQTFAKLREDAAKPFGGNQNAAGLRGTIASLAKQEALEVAKVRANAAKEARKKAEEDAKQAAGLAQASQRAVVQAEIDAMVEGTAKTAAIRRQEAQQISDNYEQQAVEARGNQQLLAQLYAAARAQQVALQQRWAREDQETARENALKLIETRISADQRLAQRQVQAAQGSFAQLEAQKNLQVVLERQAGQYAQIVANAERIGLTDEQRVTYAQKLEDAQFAVEDSVRAQADLTKQILTDAQQLRESYAKLSGTLSGETVSASEQFARSSREVGQAYRDAAPYLERFRAGALKPGEILASQTAFDKLSASLEKQQEALSEMTSEYERQRTALDSLFGTLRQFGTDLGNEELLTRALGIDQRTLKQSTDALRSLVASGKATAQQLSDGAQQVKSDYDALKSTYEDLGNLKAAPLLAQADEAAARGQQALAAELKDAADLIKDEYTRMFSGITNDIAPLMRDVGTAGLKAADDVAELGKQVKVAEQQVKDSAQKMRESFTGVFAGLTDQAGQAGADAGKRFADSLASQLRSAKLPAITVGAVPASKAAAGTSGGNVYNISIAGRSVNGSPVTGEEAALLDRLAVLAEARCRRRGS